MELTRLAPPSSHPLSKARRTAAKVITASVEQHGVAQRLQLQGSMDSATVILEDGSPLARISTYCDGFTAPRGWVGLPRTR